MSRYLVRNQRRNDGINEQKNSVNFHNLAKLIQRAKLSLD